MGLPGWYGSVLPRGAGSSWGLFVSLRRAGSAAYPPPPPSSSTRMPPPCGPLATPPVIGMFLPMPSWTPASAWLFPRQVRSPELSTFGAGVGVAGEYLMPTFTEPFLGYTPASSQRSRHVYLFNELFIGSPSRSAGRCSDAASPHHHHHHHHPSPVPPRPGSQPGAMMIY